MNLIRTAKTYKTADNARKALHNLFQQPGVMTDPLTDVRYLIAVAPDGRFAPVLVGQQYIPFIHAGITVVG